jgi:hypothetical protein
MNIHGYKKHLKEFKSLVKYWNKELHNEEAKPDNKRDWAYIKQIKIEIRKCLGSIRGYNKKLIQMKKDRNKALQRTKESNLKAKC